MVAPSGAENSRDFCNSHGIFAPLGATIVLALWLPRAARRIPAPNARAFSGWFAGPRQAMQFWHGMRGSATSPPPALTQLLQIKYFRDRIFSDSFFLVQWCVNMALFGWWDGRGRRIGKLPGPKESDIPSSPPGNGNRNGDTFRKVPRSMVPSAPLTDFLLRRGPQDKIRSVQK